MLSLVLNNKKDRFVMAKSRRDHIKKKGWYSSIKQICEG